MKSLWEYDALLSWAQCNTCTALCFSEWILEIIFPVFFSRMLKTLVFIYEAEVTMQSKDLESKWTVCLFLSISVLSTLSVCINDKELARFTKLKRRTWVYGARQNCVHTNKVASKTTCPWQVTCGTHTQPHPHCLHSTRIKSPQTAPYIESFSLGVWCLKRTNSLKFFFSRLPSQVSLSEAPLALTLGRTSMILLQWWIWGQNLKVAMFRSCMLMAMCKFITTNIQILSFSFFP